MSEIATSGYLEVVEKQEEKEKPPVPTFHQILAKMIAELFGGKVTYCAEHRPDGFYFCSHKGIATYMDFKEALEVIRKEASKHFTITCKDYNGRRSCDFEPNSPRNSGVATNAVPLDYLEYKATEWEDYTYMFLHCVMHSRYAFENK